MTIAHSQSSDASVFSHPDMTIDPPHEQVVFCRDAATGLRAIIAIHNTALGPALGGTRFYPYAAEADAVGDVLRLSRGMTFKSAAAGLDLGGGKAVIIGDPDVDKTPELLRAYGRFVDTLGGRYITAGDVGTTSDDMDLIGQGTRYVASKTVANGGCGDTAPMTALGVFSSLLAAAERVWGSADLSGRVVGVEGVGKVGTHLAGLLVDAGAVVLAADPHALAREAFAARFPQAKIVDDVRSADLDVYAPCAMGGTVTADLAGETAAAIVCGAANNQLTTPQVEQVLGSRGVVWVPDYIANAGGVIQAFSEQQTWTFDQMQQKVEDLRGRAGHVLDTAASKGITSGDAARLIVAERLSAAR
ncbi:Glu/Leu/Phe/Val family dehydrogenase [Gordonia neofelifaecis]|uniref:Valine dehydrogenase n=1 Tax=Gordonia neofelifaecis NRRL B-59395 TaxID=644548 RepID=F1YKD0_9ACTN|nr:Glu/Leu/Phe/Val dehydrogenase dimerization domain-containing protein [Gordonia neofelifaecis]EGD54816.1 valine dehydrogenase [Gordonia neofelifaecis NRRL B-59395]